MSESKRAMTVRLPEELYRAGVRVARRRRISLSRLLRDSLQATLKEEERRRLAAAFSGLGEEETEVEFAAAAQAEVARNAES